MATTSHSCRAMNDSERGLLGEIVKHLPREAGKPPLVVNLELMWTRKLHQGRAFGTLVLTTARSLTTDGGNGWTGFDGADEEALHAAVYDAVNHFGATGMIDRYIIRSTATLDQTAGDSLDHLFD